MINGVTLFIDPFSHHFQRDRLFKTAKFVTQGDNILAPWVHLRDWFQERGIPVHTADYLVDGSMRDATNVYVSFGIQQNCRTLAQRADVIPSAYFAFEGPIVEPTLYHNLSWVQRYFKRVFCFTDSESLKPVLRAPLRCDLFHIPQSYDHIHEAAWGRTDRKFLVLVHANKLPRLYWNELYTERLRAIAYFAQYGEVDLFGVGWDVPPYRVGKTWIPYTLQRIHRAWLQFWQQVHPNPLFQTAHRVWRGVAPSKPDVLGQYTFSICFDNQILNGWITEKIFDCFYSGTIPIYLGAPDVEKYIPSECFVDMRRFAGYGELRDYLKSLSQQDIQNYRERARAFLESPRFYPFSKQAFVDRCGRIIEEDTGIKIAA